LVGLVMESPTLSDGEAMGPIPPHARKAHPTA
jgi:hypothetical protein